MDKPRRQGTDFNEEHRCVVCDYCDIELELDDSELSRGWYYCPRCEQITHLVEEYTEPPETGPESLDQVPDDDWILPDVDWVPLKQVTSAEEAAQVVSGLRATGIEALARRGSAKGAFGLAIGTLNTFRVMVQENQKQQALALLDEEVDE